MVRSAMPAPADLRLAAAQQRQREIDGVRALAELAIEVEELTVNEASPGAMIHRVRARAADRPGTGRAGGRADDVRPGRHQPIGRPIGTARPSSLSGPATSGRRPMRTCSSPDRSSGIGVRCRTGNGQRSASTSAPPPSSSPPTSVVPIGHERRGCRRWSGSTTPTPSSSVRRQDALIGQVVCSIKRAITDRRSFVQVDSPTGVRDIRADDLMVELLRRTTDGRAPVRTSAPTAASGSAARRCGTVGSAGGCSRSPDGPGCR